MTDWTRTTPREYDRDAQDQPLALFPAPDGCGTRDLFDGDDMRCPDCGAFDPMGDEAAWHRDGCPAVTR